MEINLNKFCHEVQKARNALGITREEMAASLNIPVESWDILMADLRPPEEIEAHLICRKLGINVFSPQYINMLILAAHKMAEYSYPDNVVSILPKIDLPGPEHIPEYIKDGWVRKMADLIRNGEEVSLIDPDAEEAAFPDHPEDIPDDGPEVV